MATTSAEPRKCLEDPLTHLPCTALREYRKGQVIYSRHERSTSIYLVIAGKVKLARVAEDGRHTVVGIYQADEFFGESAFLDSATCDEEAIALEDTKVMSWDDIRDRGCREGAPAISDRAFADLSAAYDRVGRQNRELIAR